MKKKLTSMACAATIATSMLLQIIAPSAVLAIESSEVPETDVAVESSVSSETEDSYETSVEVTVPVESTDDTEYVEVTEDLTETEVTESSSEEEAVISSATDADPTDYVDSEITDVTESFVEETEETIETDNLEPIDPVVEFSVALPDDVAIREGDSVTVPASVTAKVTTYIYAVDADGNFSLEERTTDVDYTFEFSVDNSNGVTIGNPSDTTSDFTFENAGTYIVTGTLYVEGEAVASDDMWISVYEGFIDFDHYYSEIDDNLVNTPELIVRSDNSEVFTRNTTVLSNYDDMYIISFPDVQIARYAYSYYVTRVISIADLSAVATVASSDNADVADLSNLNQGNDALANLNDIEISEDTNFNGYIALIDTGANANFSYSVVGEDVRDNFGHGSDMLNSIREENSYARVVSIKVSEDGDANAADIYAGFRLAIDMGVSVINFSMTAPNVERNAIIADVIEEAIDAGIVVIGAAGNNAISATHFIPGCIDDVITVGAATEAGTKYRTSNYNADVYAIAESTSEATARYTGIYTAGRLVEALREYQLFEEVGSEEYWYAYEIADAMTEAAQENGESIYFSVVFNEDGTVACVADRLNDEFTVAANASEVTWASTEYTGTIPAGTYTGTCTTSTAPGHSWPSAPRAYASGFTGNNAFSNIANTLGSIPIVCSKSYEGAYYGESYASDMPRGTCNYTAVVDAQGNVTLTVASGRDASVNCGLGMSSSERTANYTYTETVSTVGSGTSMVYTLTAIYAYGTNPITGASDNYTWTGNETFTSYSALQAFVDARLSGRYSGKVNLHVGGIGTFSIEHFGSQTYEGSLYTGSTPPVSGHVFIQKVDGSGAGLAGATITLTGTFSDETRVRYAQGTPTITNTQITFVTGTSTVEIEGLVPNSHYTFTETAAPPTYQLASPDHVEFDTDADGAVIAASNGQWTWYDGAATFTLVNGAISGNGELAIFKAFDTNDSIADQTFWSNVSGLSFQCFQFNVGSYAEWVDYGFRNNVGANWSGAYYTAGNLAGSQNIRPMRGGITDSYETVYGVIYNWTQGDYGTWQENWGGTMVDVPGHYWYLSAPDASGTYYETSIEQSVQGACQGAYVYWTDPNTNQVRYSLTGLPRGIYVITEEWTQGLWGAYGTGAAIEEEVIQTLNDDPYWHLMSGNSRHRVYGIVLFVDAQGTVSVLDWNNGSVLNTYSGGAVASVTALNVENTGSLDITKIDETGNGVSDMHFEVWNTSGTRQYANGTMSSTPSGTSNGSDVYDVRWDYYTVVNENYQYRRNIAGSTSYFITDYGNRHETVSYTDIMTSSVDVIQHWTNQDAVSSLNFGMYQLREYITNIDSYRVPDGWTGMDANGDGSYEYFYKNITVNANYRSTPLVTECTNRLNGTIDVAKINITGGPNTDLQFEIFNTDTGDLVATGYIPANTEPETTGTGTTTDYTYSATWDYLTTSGSTVRGQILAVTGLGNFEVREYIPVSHYDSLDDFNAAAVGAGWSEIRTDVNGRTYVAWNVTIDESNAGDTQVATITNSLSHPTISTTLTDFADRHITVVGETIEFTDVVAYDNLYIGGSYVMHATLMDAASGQPVTDENGNPYVSETPFTTSAASGTVNVTFNVNTAHLVEATQHVDGTITYAPRSVVCFESLQLVGGYEIANHNDLTDEAQTVEIPNPEIGTTFTDLQTQEHETVSGRIVEVVDTVSYTNLHVGETYTLTCHLYDQTTGERLVYSNGDAVEGTLPFEPQTESGTVQVTFNIDTSDLLVNYFAYEERGMVAFEYLKTANGILIGGHTEIDDLAQVVTPRLPSPRTLFLDDQSGTQEGRLGSEVPFTDYVQYNNLNIGESYQMRASVVNRENPSVVYATAVVDFVPEEREGTVEVHFIIDTSEICEGSNEAYIVCFEQLWQLDTQNTGRGEVMLAKHEDVTDQGQTIHLIPEIQTEMIDPITDSHYGMIGEDVEFIDTVSFHRLRIGETYTVTGVIMDKQTGNPVLDENGDIITASTTFVPETTDGTVEVVYHLNTLRLIQQIGQTIDGVLIEAPREIVSFETITSQSGFDFAIHADIEDEDQTIILGDITSGASDLQNCTSWLTAGLTTVRDTVHYRGLGPVEYTIRGSLHLVDFDEDGNAIDGGLIHARPGEITQMEHTWTPTHHEGDVVFDYKLDSNRFQGRNIVVVEELYYNGVCIISHENYADSFGNYGWYNMDQTVHVASVWTSAFSFQSGEQLLAYDTEATVTDFVYYGNVHEGQRYFIEGSLWACYTDENGYIHSVPIAEEDGGMAVSDIFTAESDHGIAEVTFTIDSTKLFDQHYDYLLVTEKLYQAHTGYCIATHSDLTSREQSIFIPDLHTTATTEVGHTLPEGMMSDIVPVTVTDRVYYENLVVDGRSYTVVGNLQYARTDAEGNITESGPLMQNGQPVTNSVTFVPTEPTGYIDVTFEVNAADIQASGYDRIVAFEDLYFGPEGIRVGVHADITDEEQTVYVPGMETTALGTNGRHSVAATSSVTINDTVHYWGLTPGVEYRLETDLMSSKTGEAVDHVTTLFTPTESDGVITVSLTFDATGYTASDKVVVFEELYQDQEGEFGARSWLIKRHADWEDEDQTVTFGGGGDTGVHDTRGTGYLVGAGACIAAMLGLGVSEIVRKRKKNSEVDPSTEA